MAIKLNQDESQMKGDGKFCYGCIPARVVFILLGFVGFNLVYAYKVVLSVTIVSMVNHENATESKTQCNVGNSTSSEETKGEFDWDTDQQATLLGGFFYGYVVTQVGGGLLAQHYGGKWIFGGSVLITGLLALIGPVTAKHLGFVPFFITRVGQGLTEGVVFPCMNAMFARWIPKMERSLSSTIVFTGAQIGNVITLPVAAILCDGTLMGGWPAIYYILGIVGCVWFLFWALLIHETPSSHPHISQKELDYILTSQGAEKASKRPSTPWKSIFTSIPMWALILTHIGQNWGYLTVLTLLPTYFHKVLNLDIQKNGLLSSLPWLLQALVSWLVGLASDKIRQSGRVSINVIRKVCNTIGFFGPALCMIGVVFAGCDETWSIIFFSLAMGTNGFIYSGFLCTHVDMAPDFAGTLMGITNSIANTPGFIAPIVANAITKDNQTVEGWAWVFYISAAVYVGGAIIYIFFASAQLQPWGIAKKGTNDEDAVYSVTGNNRHNNKYARELNYYDNNGFIDDKK